MVDNNGQKMLKPNSEAINGLNGHGAYKPSTFAPVRESKTAPVQAQLDKVLPVVIGSSYLLMAVEEQQSTDPKNGEVQIASIYTLRVIQRKTKAFGDLIQIKVKNATPTWVVRL